MVTRAPGQIDTESNDLESKPVLPLLPPLFCLLPPRVCSRTSHRRLRSRCRAPAAAPLPCPAAVAPLLPRPSDGPPAALAPCWERTTATRARVAPSLESSAVAAARALIPCWSTSFAAIA
ncbi:hypothetical protein EJB05_52661, partial [Eragrostis curvula]